MKKFAEIDALVLGKKLIEFVELGGCVRFENELSFNNVVLRVQNIGDLGLIPGHVSNVRADLIRSLEHDDDKLSNALEKTKKKLAALR